MNDPLRPCPFCGSEAAIKSLPSLKGFYYAKCTNEACGVSRSWYETMDEAITAWNTRIDNNDAGIVRMREERDRWRNAWRRLIRLTGEALEHQSYEYINHTGRHTEE